MWCWSCWTMRGRPQGYFRLQNRRLDGGAGGRPAHRADRRRCWVSCPTRAADIDTRRSDAAAGRRLRGSTDELGALTGGGETAPVTGFAIDHRKVAPGTVFGAFRGTRVNGEDYIPEAVAAGAVAVVARPEARSKARSTSPSREPRRAFARLAAKFFAPVPGDDRRGHRHQRQDLDRRADPPAVADGRPSTGSIGTLGVTTADDR